VSSWKETGKGTREVCNRTHDRGKRTGKRGDVLVVDFTSNRASSYKGRKGRKKELKNKRDSPLKLVLTLVASTNGKRRKGW